VVARLIPLPIPAEHPIPNRSPYTVFFFYTVLTSVLLPGVRRQYLLPRSTITSPARLVSPRLLTFPSVTTKCYRPRLLYTRTLLCLHYTLLTYFYILLLWSRYSAMQVIPWYGRKQWCDCIFSAQAFWRCSVAFSSEHAAAPRDTFAGDLDRRVNLRGITGPTSCAAFSAIPQAYRLAYNSTQRDLRLIRATPGRKASGKRRWRQTLRRLRAKRERRPWYSGGIFRQPRVCFTIIFFFASLPAT